MCVSVERYDERFRARSDITAKPRSYVGELGFRTGKRMTLHKLNYYSKEVACNLLFSEEKLHMSLIYIYVYVYIYNEPGKEDFVVLF
jgi:hypothetical protein